MPSIPIPRRALRTLAALAVLLAIPYIALRSLRDLYFLSPAPSAKRIAVRTPREAEPAPADPGRGLVLQDGLVADLPARKPSHAEHAAKSRKKTKTTAEHRYLLDGLVVPDPGGQHPIYDLLDRASQAWAAKMGKASTTLRQAVDEYRKRYGRAPPKGFDRWWAWARAHDVQLPDEYDQIISDLEPFWAFTPGELRALREEASDMSGMYTLSCPGAKRITRGATSRCTYAIQEEGLNEEGRTVARERAEAQLALVRQIEDELEEVEAVFYSHDVPWQFVGHEYKSALEDAASLGEYYDVEQHELDTAHLGWASACAPHKPLRQDYNASTLPDLEGIWHGDKSFIWDHKAAMDPCLHPTTAHLVGFLSAHGKGPGPTKQLFPVMAMCKTLLHSDVLAVAEEAWTEDVGEDPAWEDKTDGRLLWRGKTTGIYFRDGVPWNISQRVNLVSHAAMTDGTVPVYPVPPPSTAIGGPEQNPWADLNAALVDVGFVDEPIQCDSEVCDVVRKAYAFKERKTWAEGNNYKYLLDLDGNGWSARFKRLMSTNSVVLKSTIFPEWYTDRIQPWIHYVPIKADLTDVYDVLTFFTQGHDDLAREIAQAGKDWSHRFWRKDDMVAYQFRLFLEMSRLMATDRDEASYNLLGEDIVEVY
ncbi:hypothetical protein Q5752_006318 [Cryptotrichosporon argae]